MISDQVTKGPDRAPHRSLFYAAGFTDEELSRIDEHAVEGGINWWAESAAG